MTSTYLFIGAGRMAEAIIKGLLRSADGTLTLIAANRTDTQRRKKLHAQYGIKVTTDWKIYVAESDVIVLAMPPEAHEEILTQLAPLVTGQLIITIAAGIGVSRLQEALPPGTSAAWVMPNTAAEIGQSMSLYTYTEALTAHHQALLEQLLDAIGTAEFCSEEQIHTLTAVTGSAPAFVYEFALAIEKAAVRYGISQEQARRLVTQMMYGSVQMLASGSSPSELRDAVTTPGGATAAGLRALEQGGYAALLMQAIEETNRRAFALGTKADL
ncbi:pyrroline-5-carboxylate reductase [Aneurinibacillus sp. REN35]|uniref:pyrroline-5-carboxylate reductase n=1 Tax=Aneurinibacillus sp. REN35 TaxID=3237286 RepID=UPI00352955B8